MFEGFWKVGCLSGKSIMELNELAKRQVTNENKQEQNNVNAGEDTDDEDEIYYTEKRQFDANAEEPSYWFTSAMKFKSRNDAETWRNSTRWSKINNKIL